jgi:hypothetical protein
MLGKESLSQNPFPNKIGQESVLELNQASISLYGKEEVGSRLRRLLSESAVNERHRHIKKEYNPTLNNNKNMADFTYCYTDSRNNTSKRESELPELFSPSSSESKTTSFQSGSVADSTTSSPFSYIHNIEAEQTDYSAPWPMSSNSKAGIVQRKKNNTLTIAIPQNHTNNNLDRLATLSENKKTCNIDISFSDSPGCEANSADPDYEYRRYNPTTYRSHTISSTLPHLSNNTQNSSFHYTTQSQSQPSSPRLHDPPEKPCQPNPPPPPPTNYHAKPKFFHRHLLQWRQLAVKLFGWSVVAETMGLDSSVLDSTPESETPLASTLLTFKHMLDCNEPTKLDSHSGTRVNILNTNMVRVLIAYQNFVPFAIS